MFAISCLCSLFLLFSYPRGVLRDKDAAYALRDKLVTESNRSDPAGETSEPAGEASEPKLAGETSEPKLAGETSEPMPAGCVPVLRKPAARSKSGPAAARPKSGLAP